MRVRVLHAKLYAYALPGSTARQLFNSSTLLDSSTHDSSTARQTSTDLDRPRQTSTELDAQAHGVRLDRLDKNSTVTRQARQARPRQDSASTAPRHVPRRRPRQLDSSTARAQTANGMRGDERGKRGSTRARYKGRVVRHAETLTPHALTRAGGPCALTPPVVRISFPDLVSHPRATR